LVVVSTTAAESWTPDEQDGIPVSELELDPDPWLLNTINGTIDHHEFPSFGSATQRTRSDTETPAPFLLIC
jgi:hypothetical protein